MAYYDLDKAQRAALSVSIKMALLNGFEQATDKSLLLYGTDEDTYIRKAAYLGIGKIYIEHPALRNIILLILKQLLHHENFKLRQTIINTAGEIGKTDFESVQHFFDEGLFDVHHSPRNAVIGSIKKMGEVNPIPVLQWAAQYLQHPDKEIRREICHGIELRGRKFPEDILPMLQSLEHDSTARVRNTLIHVLGQIAYKKGCLETVIQHLKQWQHKDLVAKALTEIIDVHYRYRNFSFYTQDQAKAYIILEMGEL